MKKISRPRIQAGFSAGLSFVGLLSVCVMLCGCGSVPSPVERYFFDIRTNLVPSVVVTTQEVKSVVLETNLAGIVAERPVLDLMVTVKTNFTAEVISSPSPALKSWVQLGSAVADGVSPGSGSLAGVLALGAAGWFGINRQRKLTAAQNQADEHAARADTYETVSENFAQSIELLREVLKKTPQGQVLDGKLVDMLHKNQVTAGIIREAAEIVNFTVSNEAAKKAAAAVLSVLPAAPGTSLGS